MEKQYTVINNTNWQIGWNDGSWWSGWIDKGAIHPVSSNHDASVNIKAKDDSGKELLLGSIVIPKCGTATIRGAYDWDITIAPPNPLPEPKVIDSGFTVINKTKWHLAWKDGGFWSGYCIDPDATHFAFSDHDANITMFASDESGNERQLGCLYIPQKRTVTIKGTWNWVIK